MSLDVYVVGMGGFGRESLDVIEAVNAAASSEVFRVAGVVDDGPSEVNLARIGARGYRWVGSLDETATAHPDSAYVMGVGAPAVRRALAKRLSRRGWHPVTVVHPRATVSPTARVGLGAVICGGVQLSTNTRLGTHVHLNPNATVGHDTVLDDFVSVNPGAIVSGEVLVSEAALIGAGAVVLQNLSVGAGATVGAHACVTRNVAAGAVVVGTPARPISGHAPHDHREETD